MNDATPSANVDKKNNRTAYLSRDACMMQKKDLYFSNILSTTFSIEAQIEAITPELP
jgi:hypothetical protein